MNGYPRSLPQSDGKPQSAKKSFKHLACREGSGLTGRRHPICSDGRWGYGSDALNGASDRIQEQLLIGCRIQLAGVGAGGDILGRHLANQLGLALIDADFR